MGSTWNTACLDWEERLLSGRTLVPDLPLFEDEADAAVRIFNRLRLPDVPQRPRLEEATGEWFRDVVRALFGSYDEKADRRMIQEVFLLVPKKNGKSTNAAAIMVVAAILTRRPEAEFLLIAPTKEIADISFRQASGMIKADPQLKDLFDCKRHTRTINHRLTGVTIQIKAADTDTITGVKATGILVDETHVFAKKPHAAEIFVEVRGALASRPDGFMIQISTQSKDPPSGVFKSELMSARAVRDGEVSLPLLSVIYELPRRMIVSGGWKDESTWPLVNPNLGRSVDLDFLRREVLKAERDGPVALAMIASQHFNVEIGIGQHSDRWPGAEFWQRRANPALTLDAILDRSEVVIIGIDGGGLDDLFGLAVLGREREEILAPATIGHNSVMAKTKRWLLWSHAWCHEGVLDRRKSIAAKLLEFKAAGELTIVDDELGDLSSIIEIVSMVKDRQLLGCVALDPAGIGELVDALNAIDVTEENKLLRGVGQGWRLMNAIDTGGRRLVNGTLLHGGSGLMAWCVGNLKIERTATALRATKVNAGDAKIDPAMAMFDAIDLMTLNPAAAPEYQMLFV